MGGGSRPNMGGGGNRPNIGGGGGNRPNIGGGSRPGTGGGNRPGTGNIGGGNRPNTGGGRPIAGGGNRPNIDGGNRPGIGNGGRPGVGPSRPGQGGAGDRFPGNNRPGQGGAGDRFPGNNRPGQGGAGDRFPGNNRPGTLPGQGGIGDRFPGNRPNTLPGQGGDRFPGNRPNFPNRNNIGNNIGNNININNNRNNNFAVGNGNRWNNNWHHGYWGGNNWRGNAAAWGLGWGAGYRHGNWNNYANRSWYRPWYSNPAVWGLGGWALGSVYYDSGYGYYSNPYYVSGASFYDYSQPIQVVSTQDTVQANLAPDQDAAPPQPPPEVLTSQTHLNAAQDAFMAGDYVKAGSEIDLAIKAQPTDAALHEFRALIYFATQDFDKAAGALYAVLSAGPGWDWTTLASLYPNVDTYTTQLRALEQYVKANPDASSAHFVLAYQYITAGHKDAAIRQLKDVARLMPNDQLTAQLIQTLGGTEPGAETPPAEDDSAGAVAEQPAPPDIDAAKLVGLRTAKRSDGTTFTLNLTDDQKFTWGFERDGKTQEFGGTYSVDGAVLVLEREDKSTMPGLVTMEDGGFNFKLFGAPESDPGLDFRS